MSNDKDASKPAAPTSYDGLTEEFVDEVVRLCDDAPGSRNAVYAALEHCNAEIVPAAPSVDQDERGACMCSGLGPCERPGDVSCRIARAASNAAPSVEQDERGAWVNEPPRMPWEGAQNEDERAAVNFYANNPSAALFDFLNSPRRAASTSANVAQGAEAVGEIVANDPVHGWYFQPFIGWEQLGAGTKLYTAPPAQPTLTDDARDAARYRWLRSHAYTDDFIIFSYSDGVSAFALRGSEADHRIDAALTAAQSASGDAK